MLSNLHDEIAKILEIESINIGHDGSINIDYKQKPNESQLNQINEIIQKWPLKKAKQDKLKLIDLEYLETEKNGWDSGLGYSLGIAANDVALLTGAYALAKEADVLGLPLPKFIAMNNNVISFNSLSEMTQLLLRYGDARANLSSIFANRRKAVENATSIEELNSI